jgi:hypothetical protein
VETRTAGAEGGPGKRAGRDPGTAPRSDPYYPVKVWVNGHEWAKQQCLKAGIAFTALDNAFGTVSDPAAVQRICDGLTDQKIYRFAGKWLARLPQPFTRADQDAGYCWQLPVQQVEFSTTMALDRPVTGRIFFEQLIRDNLGIGRPDKVSIVFGRMIRRRGKSRDPRDLPHPGHHQRRLPLPLPVLHENPGRAVPQGRTSAPHRDHLQPAPC